MPEGALRVAIVGAESTGKSALALALARRLEEDFDLTCAVVAEHLREWCEERGRTPRPEEQAAIAAEQQRRIDQAATRAGTDVVVCDTTPVMTSVYSELLFGDRSLDDLAADCQRGADLTLLTALDLPWVADGLMRDGPQVREPVDRALRARLRAWGVRWSVVQGTGDARTTSACDALRPLLRERAQRTRGGLFGRLAGAGTGPASRPWRCEHCDDPRCERLSRHAPAGRREPGEPWI